MIINLIINVILLMIGTVFSFLPAVDTLPTIAGYDIDAALLNGMGFFNNFIQSFWYIGDVFYAFLFLMGYYAIKVLLKAFLGSRAPQ